MPRLVTFGCSHTYGHGLFDCCDQDLNPGPHPSKYAWPQLVADKLGYECVNLSEPGSGNFQILITLLKTKLNPDDLVIIAFSYFIRYNFYTMTDKTGNGKMFKMSAAKSQITTNKVIETFDDEYWEEKNYWDNWLTIQHCELYLNSLNIRNFSFLNLPNGALETKPDLIKLNNFWDDMKLILKDKGLDGKHPGMSSHKNQANKIYEKLGKTSIAI
jgi:hypothetical protein